MSVIERGSTLVAFLGWKWDGTWTPEAAATAVGVIAASVAAIASLVLLGRQNRVASSLADLEVARRRDEQRAAWLRTEPVLLIDAPRAELVAPGKQEWFVRVRNVGGDETDVQVNVAFNPPGGGISIGGRPAPISAGGEHSFEITSDIDQIQPLADQHNQALAQANRKSWQVWGRIHTSSTSRAVAATIAGDSITGSWLSTDWEIYETPDGRRGVRSIEHPRWNHLSVPETRGVGLRGRLASWISPETGR